jgi:hypothetical protein
MSLERKDFRGRLDPAWHDLMRSVADAHGVTDAEWIESLIKAELTKIVHVSTVIAQAAQRAGISGNPAELPGAPGNRAPLTP